MPRTEFALLRLALSLEGIPNRLSKLRMLIVALENGEAERSSRIYRRIRAALISVSKMPNISDDDLALSLRLRLRLDGIDKAKLKTREDKEKHVAELRARLKMSHDESLVAPPPKTGGPDIFDNIDDFLKEVKK
ncbi:MAG: hypothetical protein WBL50_18360 [Candidatus Acidiferrum sp.]